MEKPSILGPRITAGAFLLVAAMLSPIIFPTLLSTQLTSRENILLWIISIGMVLVGIAFITFAKKKKAIAAILLLLVMGGLSALILEIGLRFVIKPEESLLIYRQAPEQRHGFRLKPELNIETQFAKSPVKILTSADGMRVPEKYQLNPTAAQRIAFIGDSFTFGLWANSAENSFPYLVQSSLGVSNTAVFNLGVPGYGIEDSLAQLIQLWPTIKPNLVVLSIFNGNDLLDTYLGVERYKVRNDGLLELDKIRLNRMIPESYRQPDFQLESWLGEHLYLAKAAARVIGLINQAKHANDEASPTELPEDRTYSSSIFWSLKNYPGFALDAKRRTLDELDKLAAFCNERHTPLLIVAIPFQEQVVLPQLFEPTYSSKLPQQIFGDFARRRNIPFLDLQPILRAAYQADAAPLYYYFDGHFNNRGHQVSASAISEKVKRLLPQP